MKRHIATKTGTIALALATTGAAQIAQAADMSTRVRVNGRMLTTNVAPIQMNGRTLVPMRAIFEALGATVQYNAATRGIMAMRGTTNIGLSIGSRTATVNNQTVMLEQSPLVMRRATLVPLRFVSEALGARVNWNARTRVANIMSGSGSMAAMPSAGSQVAGVRTISVPRGAVVPVTLDTQLSSETARRGETFTASITSEQAGDSEFPAGTKVEGVVREATARNGENPGVLDLDFRTVVTPDGARHAIQGGLISLDNDSVTSTQQGRIMAKNSASSNNKDRNKTVIIGAGAGFLLGKILKKNSIITGLLGAAGGYLYDNQKNKDRVAEAVLPQGTRLGVRLDRTVSYADATDYYPTRASFFKM